MVVDGRTLVKAGLRPPPPAAKGLDKGPAIDKSRCREIEGQERAANQMRDPLLTKRGAGKNRLFDNKRRSLESARRSARGTVEKARASTTVPQEQNQKERTFDVLPKPANLISYRQKFVEKFVEALGS